MAHVTLPPFIQSISGRVGNLCFRTSAEGKTTVYVNAKKSRSTPLTKQEVHARELFAERVQRVNKIMQENPSITRKQAWKIAKQIPS